MATILTVAPLTTVLQIMQEPSSEALGSVASVAFFCGVGAILFIPALRKVVFSQEGIEVRGFRPFRMRWEEVTEMPAQSGGAMSNIHFKRADGRKIVVDATMNGWHELLRFLAQLPPGNARTMAASALAELNRWK